MSQTSKSVTEEQFLLSIRAHEILHHSGSTIIHDKVSDMSVWSVAGFPVGCTRGSMSNFKQGLDCYLFTGMSKDNTERYLDILENIGSHS